MGILGQFERPLGTEAARCALTGMTNHETACWQCGAPADPGCAYTQSLVNRNDYADGFGLPVKRGKRGQSLTKLSIPRCETCQLRNYITAFLGFIGLFAGACIGGLQFPSRGFFTIIGALLGFVPILLGTWCYRRARGLRSINDYPMLKNLKAAGWEEPG
jgi:hypothetical protein